VDMADTILSQEVIMVKPIVKPNHVDDWVALDEWAIEKGIMTPDNRTGLDNWIFYCLFHGNMGWISWPMHNYLRNLNL